MTPEQRQQAAQALTDATLLLHSGASRSAVLHALERAQRPMGVLITADTDPWWQWGNYLSAAAKTAAAQGLANAVNREAVERLYTTAKTMPPPYPVSVKL